MQVKYDVEGVEAGGDRELPKAGVYAVKITDETEFRTKGGKPNAEGKNDIHLVMEITAPKENKGFPLHDYVSFNAGAEFRIAQLTDALGLPRAGSLDEKKLVGKALKARVKITNSEEYGKQVKVASLLPKDAGSDSEDLDEDTGAEPDDGEDYSEWDVDDLKAELEERELKVSGRFSKAKAVAVLEAADAENDEDPEDPESEESGDGDEKPDFDEMSPSDLKGYFEENHSDEDLSEIVGKGPASKKAERLREWLKENAEEGGEEGAEPEDDYDDWDLDDLKAEVKERGVEVSGRANKAKLIAALRENDAEDDPFAE